MVFAIAVLGMCPQTIDSNMWTTYISRYLHEPQAVCQRHLDTILTQWVCYTVVQCLVGCKPCMTKILSFKINFEPTDRPCLLPPWRPERGNFFWWGCMRPYGHSLSLPASLTVNMSKLGENILFTHKPHQNNSTSSRVIMNEKWNKKKKHSKAFWIKLQSNLWIATTEGTGNKRSYFSDGLIWQVWFKFFQYGLVHMPLHEPSSSTIGSSHMHAGA